MYLFLRYICARFIRRMGFGLCAALLLALLAGCTSMVKVPPYPPSQTRWDGSIEPLGEVTADSGSWPLSLASLPPDQTFHSALIANAANKYGVPQDEIVLSEATVEIRAEAVGTIRSWKATAKAGRDHSRGSSEGLSELKRLLDAGLITPQDYERKKAEILDRL